VFGVLKDHVDAFVFEDDLDKPDDVGVAQLAAESHLAYRRLADARVCDLLALFVRLEFLDRKFARLSLPAQGLVNPPISTATNEADDAVFVRDPDLAMITNVATATIRGI